MKTLTPAEQQEILETLRRTLEALKSASTYIPVKQAKCTGDRFAAARANAAAQLAKFKA